jgi:hypothetical protein
MTPPPPACTVRVEVFAMMRHGVGQPPRAHVGALPRASVLSFTLGLLALRVCWLPGDNCLLALAAVTLGLLALAQISHHHDAPGGTEEAVTGVVLGVLVLGLSTFFISALVVAYR